MIVIYCVVPVVVVLLLVVIIFVVWRVRKFRGKCFLLQTLASMLVPFHFQHRHP